MRARAVGTGNPRDDLLREVAPHRPRAVVQVVERELQQVERAACAPNAKGIQSASACSQQGTLGSVGRKS